MDREQFSRLKPRSRTKIVIYNLIDILGIKIKTNRIVKKGDKKEKKIENENSFPLEY